MASSITKMEIDRLLQEMSNQNKEIAAIRKSFREIDSSIKQMLFRVNRLMID